ncbi:hypothetical protein PHMEG_00038141 [Phytophthora megakarya]|uniref:Uncharacterized protein n=1 Tax=Phytophthora megakarya TaxID=4795 RepID=A0A225UKQ1_9STRA|nr:hypothetical protein PHMEG_00038141 [Phytophthora megakarya]
MDGPSGIPPHIELYKQEEDTNKAYYVVIEMYLVKTKLQLHHHNLCTSGIINFIIPPKSSNFVAQTH